MASWAEAAVKKSRETLPRLQRELDAARVRLDELRQQLASVERASAKLDPGADPDLAVAVQVASQLLPALVTEAEEAVAAAMAARREARAVLLPETESAWAPIVAARQAAARAQGAWDAARSRMAELQRGRAAALATVRQAGPASDMVALAAAEAQLRMTDHALPAAQSAVTAAEVVAEEARSAVATFEARAHTLRLDVLTAEPQQAEAALVELREIVGPERSGLILH